MKRLPSFVPAGAGMMALALVIGTLGGALFAYLQLPLPWMTGPLLATTVATMSGIPLKGPGGVRGIVVAVIGTMVGSSFTPNVIDEAGRWIGTIVAMVVFILLLMASVSYTLHRHFKFGPATAYFSAAPGGFNQIMVLGSALGGDDRVIALIQSVRVTLTVLMIPFWFRLLEGYDPDRAMPFAKIGDIGAFDATALAACAVAGYWIGVRIRLPVPALIGPMILSATLHLTGVTAASPPNEFVNLAQIVIGTSAGCRFTGITVRRVFGTLMIGGLTTVYMLAVTLASALALEYAFDLPFAKVLLAFAPGGLAEMVLVSLAMGIDPAFVSVHHLVRLVVIYTAVPFAFRLLSARAGKGTGVSGDRPPPPD
ncbi:MAG: AbrB family transcriptional regulator [Rhodospirillales bacterium]|nr:AbrB family transcriptional regulator [Rhodospirillales bacterium]